LIVSCEYEVTLFSISEEEAFIAINPTTPSGIIEIKIKDANSLELIFVRLKAVSENTSSHLKSFNNGFKKNEKSNFFKKSGVFGSLIRIIIFPLYNLSF
jgi:hypothetical protein